MPAYFDHNATTPLHPAAREAWLEANDKFWHNPSGLYREAAAVKNELELAREELADLIDTDPERIVFTSGATEANNTLFFHFARRFPNHSVLTSSIEHPSVREPLRHHFPKSTIPIPTRDDSTLDFQAIQQILSSTPDIAVVSIMAANNECGTLLPWQEISRLCKERDIPFHCDAAQWLGKLPVNELGRCDYLTASAHKFGGPKGIGFLVLRDEDERPAFLTGGPQEEGRRAGTENYPAIAAMLAALKTADAQASDHAAIDLRSQWRDQFIQQVIESIPGTRLIGANAPRLWNTVMLVLPRHDNRKWLARLSNRGFAISTGSACSAGHDGSSVVLSALGASPDEMRRVIRLSSGWNTTQKDWQALAQALLDVAGDLDQNLNLPAGSR